jgi:ABC-type Na+ efflux pump permease subunit
VTPSQAVARDEPVEGVEGLHLEGRHLEGPHEGSWREIRAIAELEALDGLRDRRQLVLRAVTPIVLFLCVAAVTLAFRGTETTSHPDPYRVAVEGDYDGARATLEHLSPRLSFYPVTDARTATFTGAEGAIRVPNALDRTLADPHAVVADVVVYEDTIDSASRAATIIIEAAFADIASGRARAAAVELPGTPGTTAPPGAFTVRSEDVELTSSGSQTLTSQIIPGLVCLQAALLIAGTANRLVSRRTRGVLTAQLLLPVSRRNLALAKGLGELVVDTVTAVPIVAALVAFGALVALHDGRLGDALVGTVAVIASVVVLFAIAAATGVVIGTASRTQEQVSLATGAAVVVAALVAATVALGPPPPTDLIALVPFAGTVAMLREILNGTGSWPAFGVSVATSALGAFAVIALGGRSLDAQRIVTRGG